MAQVRDVVIVGAGLLGLSAGRALAARGRDVVVLEQATAGHEGAGSKGSCRIFRLGYPDPGYVAAARQARELWHELEGATGHRILHPVQQVTFGPELEAVQEAMLAAGAPCELLPAAEAARRFPAVRVDGPALLEPDSAVIAADEALRALAASGPEIRPGIRVTSLADDGRQVTLQTSAGPVLTRTAIIAAGPWSGRLAATLGLTVPVTATMEQVCYLQRRGGATAGAGPDAATWPDGPPPPVFICHGSPAPFGLPVPGSALYKIGIHPSGPAVDPDAQPQGPDPALSARIAAIAARYLPGYDSEPARTERCVYDNSPDEDFIIDRRGNVVIGCGTSGHGFKFGPLFGEWLAQLADAAPAAPAGRAPGSQPDVAERFALPGFAAARFGLARFGAGN
jgi:sarcosine oxidase